ncbi:hypothetical protein PPTG_18712 [Phytophthora nicotianae INRA-310]|uniref:Uncharacterized protein n=1 Tax=Phytophthora nicotianae (strain INRA-310) TaxID=761204 RepID=W2PGV4_PHYN3|nr:hypothetical protein PPTG_18712 [Phytophthora nicotianae INRA-310]ETM99458.1 hypothetical protein PPTG_18712 [Phytophthora nicotianae INRA-310]
MSMSTATARGDALSIESDPDGYLLFVTVLQCDKNGVVKCTSTSDTIHYGGTWRIVEPRVTISCVPNVPTLRDDLTGTERQDFIVELTKCGKTPAEIERIVIRMFNSPLVSSSKAATYIEKK